MTAPTWIVADAHAGANPETDAALLALFVEARARKAHLLIMGDLFTAWLGPKKFHTPLQARLLDELVLLRRAGGRVQFVIGNRDYLAEAQRGLAFDDVLGPESMVSLGGIPTLLHHGDGLNARDWSYRGWRALSRSGVSETFLGALPQQWGRRLVHRTERQMAPLNAGHKTGQLPRAALHALAARAQTQGAQRVLVGHFHQDTVLEAAVVVVLAPAFADTGRILEVKSADLVSVSARSLIASRPRLVR